jgi:hypothetical protein
MVNLKQQFDLIDYFGPLIVFAVFIVVLLLASFFIFNYCFVRKLDDYTVFEEVIINVNI